MSELIVHTQGGQYATLDDLKSVPLPEETDSYIPVSHFDLAVNLAKVAKDLLNGYFFHKSQYGLARDGRQMFGVHTYQLDSEEMGLSIGFRNSYDKSMSVGIAIGASVFVCDNLAFTGDITVMRKHTLNVWADLEETIVTTIYRSQHNFQRIREDADEMKCQGVENDEAFKIMGLLFGKNMVTPRQLPVLKQEWLRPTYEEFLPRSKWSLYNAATEALKSCPPNKILEKHIQLHQFFSAN